MKRLIVMCDYGLDDAIATLRLLKERPDLPLDVVAIGGNFSAEISLLNAKKLLSVVGADPKTVRLVDTTAEPQCYERVCQIHGQDGMGDCIFGEAEYPSLEFSKWISDVEEGDDLLCLGPMTLCEQILSRIGRGRFVFMGGCVDEIANYNGYEFNHGINPDAFSRCVKRPHYAITLDVACPALDVSDRVLGGTLIEKMTAIYRSHCLENGEIGCYVWDEIAVDAYLFPDCFVYEEQIDSFGNRLTVARFVGTKPGV